MHFLYALLIGSKIDSEGSANAVGWIGDCRFLVGRSRVSRPDPPETLLRQRSRRVVFLKFFMIKGLKMVPDTFSLLFSAYRSLAVLDFSDPSVSCWDRSP